MNRRNFFKSLAAAPALGLLSPREAAADLPKAKITRVRIYRPPNLNPLFNQSNMVVTVETDIGITGIGEGGAKDTLEQCAGTLIGKNPFRIEAIWQEAYIAWFYPPGREKTHALGALDLALWDIKGKALEAAGARTARRHGARLLRVLRDGRRAPAGTPAGATLSLKERARATMEAGYRAFRMGAGDVPIGERLRHARGRPARSRRTAGTCARASGRTATGASTCTSASTSTTRCASARSMEEFDPFFVEDPVRDEHALQDIPKLRPMTTVPLTHGEEWGLKWDFNRLVENHDVDFIRSTLPNVGGITEMMKVAAICETHAVGIIPHFTGPIATAGAGQLPVDVLGSGADGVQLRRPADRLPAGVPGLQERQGVHEPAPGPRRDGRDEAADADRRGDRAGAPQRLQAAGRVADALVAATRRLLVGPLSVPYPSPWLVLGF